MTVRNRTLITVWGRKAGNRIIADIIVFASPFVMKAPEETNHEFNSTRMRSVLGCAAVAWGAGHPMRIDIKEIKKWKHKNQKHWLGANLFCRI